MVLPAQIKEGELGMSSALSVGRPIQFRACGADGKPPL